MKQVNWIGVILSLAVAIAAVRAVDMTKSIQATGSHVVQAVIDAIGEKCIFPNDRLFIRRMAYVETEDGTDSSTFRPGFYGGIWQITKSNYEATRLCKGNRLRAACLKIKEEFKIDWKNTKWEDLLKPFYSGLAAYLSLYLHNPTVPGRPNEQEKMWMDVFHPKNFNATRNFTEVSTSLSSSCTVKADLVFLLDESGSVGKKNFDKVKNFLMSTVQKLVIGPDDIRISLVKFGSKTTVVSYLNANNNNSEVESTISKLIYKGGGTPTDKGINAVVNDVFTTKHGAKETKDIPRMLVLVTDGQSDNNKRTVAAARAAKSNKISIISVGVGSGIDYDELRQVADKCNLVFTLESFDDFDNFIYQLTKKTCDAKAHMTFKPSDGNDTETINKTVRFKEKEKIGGVTVDSDNSTEGHTIVIESKCAVVKIYGSYDNENPSESMFQISGTASDGRPIVLFVKADKDGKPLFLSYKATKVNRTDKVCFNESSFIMKINKGKKEVADIICDENGSLRNCTSVDMIQNKWQDKICTRASDISVIGNPCTPDRLRAKELFLPHPNDNTKFLKCDLKGRVYVIICPTGLFYEPGRDSCGTETSLPDTKERLVSNNNPCTHEAVMQHRMYFPYPANHHYYIQCDQWGGAWTVPCSSDEVWDQKLTQCIPENVEVKSPCTDEARKAGEFFFPYPPDKHKFIHCKNDNSFIVQSCGNMVYDAKVHNCLPG